MSIQWGMMGDAGRALGQGIESAFGSYVKARNDAAALEALKSDPRFAGMFGASDAQPQQTLAALGPQPVAQPAPQPQQSLSPPGNFPQSLVRTESGGNWAAQNNAMGAGGKAGHFGRLQFGQARLQDAMNAGAIPQGMTPQQFMASPEAQRRAEQWHFADIDRNIQQSGLDKAIGSTINGVPVTLDGMRAVAHLGGFGGLQKFIQTGGAYNPSDANGTSLMSYMQQHGGQQQRTNPLANIQPMQSSAPQQQPMTLAQLSPQPQQPPMNMETLGALMRSEKYAPLATAIMSKQLGRDPIEQQMAQVRLMQAQQALAGGSPMQQQLSQAQLEAAQLANQRARAEMSGEGAKLSQVDLGENIGFVNQKGELVRQIPKSQKPVALGADQTLVNPQTGAVIAGSPQNTVTKEAMKEIGQAEGKQAAAAPQALMSGQMALKGIDEVMNHPNFNSNIIGGALGAPGAVNTRIPGTAAYGLKQRIDQLKGQTFLQAYEGLRGGGAITEVEGKKAQDAIARLDTAQSPADLKQALEDFRGVIRLGMERAAKMGKKFGTVPQDQHIGMPQPPQAGGISEGATATNPQTGQKIRFSNGQWVPVQ